MSSNNVSLLSVYFGLFSILFSLTIVRCDPQITNHASEVSSSVGSDVVLSCEVIDLGEHKVNWYFLKDNTQISSGNTILVTPAFQYSIVRPQDLNNNDQHWNLQINDVQLGSAGHYKCEIDDGQGANSSIIHTLNVDGASPLPDVVGSASFNFSDCCLDKNVSSSCQPACFPSQIDTSTFDLNISCTLDLSKILACAADGRNHLSCCKRRNIPTECFDFCYGQIPENLGLEHVACLTNIVDLLLCAEEGQVLLPSPPTSVTAVGVLGERVIVTWGKPLENAASVVGYKVVFKANPDNSFSSSIQLGKDATSYNLPNVKENSVYSVYVVAVSTFGSSMPSAVIEVTTSKSVPTDQDQVFQDCCEENEVSSKCSRELCSRSVLHQMNPDTILSCIDELTGVFKCFAGGRNHSSCCLVNGVPDVCFGLCAGKPPPLSWEITQCFIHLPLIEGCIQEGIAILPGPPTMVKVSEVTDTSALISWEPPSKDVQYYIIEYQLIGSKSANQIKVDGESLFLNQLQSNRQYEASIVSGNDNGTSLPSAKVRFLTYETEIDLPATVSTPKLNLAVNVTACCEGKNVPSKCLGFCRYDWRADSADMSLAFSCIDHFLNILSCGTDGRDHSACCKQRGIEEDCDAICRYQEGDNLGYEYLKCLMKINLAIPCFEEGVVSLPLPPANFTVQNVRLHTALLTWSAPPRGPRVEQYIVRYSSDNSHWSHHNTTNMPYILQNLKSGTPYSIYILSENENGTSFPSPTIEMWTVTTDVIPTPTFGNGTAVNWTITWENRTDCCSKQNLSYQCLQQCMSVSFSDPTQCEDNIDKVIACSVNGQNHSHCCSEYGVPKVCLPICEGNILQKDGVGALCISYIQTILTCFTEGRGLLPSKPGKVFASNIEEQSVNLFWMPPTLNCDSSNCIYTIIYWKKGTDNVLLKMNITDLSQVVTGLLPLTSYVFTVVAVNKYGSSLPSLQLMIITQSPAFIQMSIFQSPDGIVDEGLTVVLKCRVFGTPEIQVRWERNNLVSQTAHQLTLHNIVGSNSGNYTCVAYTESGTIQEKKTLLKIRYKPSALPSSNVYTAPSLGLTATLQCDFYGYPEYIVWYKNRNPLSTDSKYRKMLYILQDTLIMRAQLKIYNVHIEDYGDYQCNGSNAYGFELGHLQLFNENEIRTTISPDTSYQNVTNITDCCAKHNLDPICLEICSPDIDLSKAKNDNRYLKCVVHLEVYTRCASDKRDHTKCCSEEKVTSTCWPYCNGTTTSHEDALSCIGFADTIISCIRQGYVNIPSPPLDVEAKQVVRDILVTWKPPLKNPDKVKIYEVRYTSSVNPTEQVSKLTHTYTELRVPDVLDNVTYKFWMFAANDKEERSHISNIATIAITGLVPSVVVIQSHHITSGQNLNITWSPPENGAVVDYYTVYYKVSEDTDYDMKTTKMTSMQLDNLKPNSKYQIYVIASNAQGQGEKSKESDFYIQTSTGDKKKTTTTIGLAVGITLTVLLIIGAVILAVFFIRRHRNKQFSHKAVSFENPQYGHRDQVQISGLPQNHLTNEQQFGYTPLHEDQEHDESANLTFSQA